MRAIATGGRQVRTAPEFGHIYDHFAVVYEYDNGVFCTAMCRQQNGTDKKVGNEFTGTNGSALVLPTYVINGPTAVEVRQGEPNDMYVQEHTDLIASIRAGKPLNELKQVAESSLTAIMGRMSAYSGKTVTWDEAMSSSGVADAADAHVGTDAGASGPVAGAGDDDVARVQRSGRGSERVGQMLRALLTTAGLSAAPHARQVN